VVKDYGVRRARRPTPLPLALSGLSILIVVASMAVFKTHEVTAEHRWIVAQAKAWTIAGPPCPSIGALSDVPYAIHPLETFSFQGVRFSRAYGYVSCQDILERQGRGPGTITVCQFNSPTVLQVVAPRARGLWLTDTHRATVTIAGDGAPRCVLNAQPRFD
jgi:hypothetical protein